MWLLGAGRDVVAVSERLGHWSPPLTLHVYAHSIHRRNGSSFEHSARHSSKKTDSDMIPTCGQLRGCFGVSFRWLLNVRGR
jgi:hypothetical protein